MLSSSVQKTYVLSYRYFQTECPILSRRGGDKIRKHLSTVRPCTVQEGERKNSHFTLSLSPFLSGVLHTYVGPKGTPWDSTCVETAAAVGRAHDACPS